MSGVEDKGNPKVDDDDDEEEILLQAMPQKEKTKAIEIINEKEIKAINTLLQSVRSISKRSSKK
jgi:hypothetical protein